MRTVAALLLLAIACGKSEPPPETLPAPTTQPITGPRVIFPDGFVVGLEVVADQESRAEGLMYRDQLRPDHGMLFVFPEDGEYAFWMKNTKIPLDMIWIESTKRVAHVKHDVPPCYIDDCPSYPPGAQARYVLEVAAGVAKQHGLKAGDVLRFEQTDAFVAR